MTSTTEAGGGLREVARRAVQGEIAGTAMRLFREQGFEQTTVDQVAAAVGMSSRSLFRYFPTKEDMVVGGMLAIGQALADALLRRPKSESPWEALRRALDGHLDALKTDGGKALAQATMLSTTPSLRAAQREKHSQWLDLLTPLTALHLTGPPGTLELRARAITSAVLSCLDVAVDAWVASGGDRDLDILLDEAIKAVRA